MRSATDWDLGMLLGKLLERGDQTLARLASIDERLLEGDQRMTELTHQAHAIKERLGKLEAAPKVSEPPPWERWAKDLLRYLLPLGALWVTGSIDAAVKLLGAMK